MKTLVIAAGIVAALNSSLLWGSRALAAFQASSEPVGLVLWGIVLFVVAGSLKRRSERVTSLQQHRKPNAFSLANVLTPVDQFEAPERGV